MLAKYNRVCVWFDQWICTWDIRVFALVVFQALRPINEENTKYFWLVHRVCVHVCWSYGTSLHKNSFDDFVSVIMYNCPNLVCERYLQSCTDSGKKHRSWFCFHVVFIHPNAT